MENQGAIVPAGNGVRQTAKRRSWTILEEKVLLQAFMEIIGQGWKTQNGFRNGFLMQLEGKLRHAIPGTDLRAEPMISSKYGTWKKAFKDVQEVLRGSGFGWNSSTKTVIAYPTHVWDELIAAHPHLAYIREKPFPFYEQWVEIYGRDIANGAGAMDFQRAAMNLPMPNFDPMPELPPPHPLPNNAGQGNHSPNHSPAGTEDDQEGSHNTNHSSSHDNGSHSSASPTENVKSPTFGSPSGSRKRKSVDVHDELIDAITNSWDKATEAMHLIASRMGDEIDAARNRSLLYESIGKLSIVVDLNDRIRASVMLAMNPKAMDVFFGLPDEAKACLVHMALDGELQKFV